MHPHFTLSLIIFCQWFVNSASPTQLAGVKAGLSSGMVEREFRSSSATVKEIEEYTLTLELEHVDQLIICLLF